MPASHRVTFQDNYISKELKHSPFTSHTNPKAIEMDIKATRI